MFEKFYHSFGCGHRILQAKFYGPIEQSVASLTADIGVVSLIPAWSQYTFMEIGHEIISRPVFKKGWCQLQVKVCAPSLVKLAQEKVWLGEA